MCEERTHLDVSVDEALLVQELDAEDHLREKYLRLGLAEACAITLDAMREVEEELASAQKLMLCLPSTLRACADPSTMT